tara:strand:+ start:89 stop:295 length:207 start_codon:yes stop_codon:yes gene_type:complete
MTNTPTETEIKNLIERAESHELGSEFLLNGSLDAVAATFGVHAFVVDGARDTLSNVQINTATSKTVEA